MISASAFPKEKPASVSSWVNLNGRIILRNAAGRNGAPLVETARRFSNSNALRDFNRPRAPP
jgi:hypothetical protein